MRRISTYANIDAALSPPGECTPYTLDAAITEAGEPLPDGKHVLTLAAEDWARVEIREWCAANPVHVMVRWRDGRVRGV